MTAWVGARYCGDGWLAVAFDEDGYDDAAVLDDVGDLWFRYEERAERILVDVPIGLPGGEGARRRCDELAARAVGERSDAVREAPVEGAIRKRRYAVANRVHERQTGRELPRAAFERSDAVAVLRDLLGEFPEAREVIAESRPAVCFRAFAGRPMDHDRETAGGYAERMRTLASVDRDAPPAVQSAASAVAGREVTVADVLDALALAYTAWPRGDPLRSLPPDPDLDAAGLPMRIVYRAETPLVEE